MTSRWPFTKRSQARYTSYVPDGKLPPFIRFESQRQFVRETIARETGLRKDGTQFVDDLAEGRSSLEYRAIVNADGSPSSTVSDTYSWTPGTELTRAILSSFPPTPSGRSSSAWPW